MYNYNDRFAYNYNPEKYRRFQKAAMLAYFDVLTASCEHSEYNRYTFKLHTKSGTILCVVCEESEFYRVHTVVDNTEECYRPQICIDKCRIDRERVTA